ncbi:hypothetical protein Droror1_Dr00023227 [Drosera rotundifolia]
MQSSAAKVLDKSIAVTSRNKYTRASSSNDQEQVNLSLELWKNAFKDACERLCPVRGGGHECGCLPVLAKLVNLLFFLQLISSRLMLLLDQIFRLCDQ